MSSTSIINDTQAVAFIQAPALYEGNSLLPMCFIESFSIGTALKLYHTLHKD
jgi:hypothetical protein